MTPGSLITYTNKGLYCKEGDFYIDPWKKVDKAIITHAHADHARWGMKSYLAYKGNEGILKHRLGKDIGFRGEDFNTPITINGVEVTFFPAGHIPGSAQVRIRNKKECWVVSGDYKLNQDGISHPFEPVTCDHFITESTFGLPVFQWEESDEVFRKLNLYWKECFDAGENLLLSAYSLGKSQRILANLDYSIGDVFVHTAIHQSNLALLDQFPSFKLFTNNTRLVKEISKDKAKNKPFLVLSPPAGISDALIKKLGKHRSASCSGWMAMRGTKRWNNYDKGFVISDHADWNELNTACLATKAENIYVTHGYSDTFSRYLSEKHGLNAQVLKTQFGEGE